jgi:hypothetical protein
MAFAKGDRVKHIDIPLVRGTVTAIEVEDERSYYRIEWDDGSELGALYDESVLDAAPVESHTESGEKARVDEHGCATEDLVKIVEEKAGTVTIYYTPDGSFTSKSLTIPKKKYRKAAMEYAEWVAKQAGVEVSVSVEPTKEHE